MITDVVAGKKPPTWYARMAYSPEKSLPYLLKQLSTTDFTAEDGPSHRGTPLFVPSLVYQILGTRYTYVLGPASATLHPKR